jgi:hypothetical protein
MADEYLRLLTGQLQVMLLWTISRERFGLPYNGLDPEQEKIVLDLAYSQVRFFASVLTPEKVAEMNTPFPPEVLFPPGGKVH